MRLARRCTRARSTSIECSPTRPTSNHAWPCFAIRRSATASATPSRTRTAIPTRAPTLPPPHWDVLHVNQVSRPENEKYVGRSLADIAAERGVHPTDAMIDIALSEDLTSSSCGAPRRRSGSTGTRVAQADPHMVVGTSDGGAHLDRDDGAEAHSYFLQHWVREWQGFTLEEGVRQITAIPAALCGIIDRGAAAARLRRRHLRLRPRHDRPGAQGVRARLPQRRGPLGLEARGRARDDRQRRADRARRRVASRRRAARTGPAAERASTPRVQRMRAIVWTGELEVRDDVEVRAPGRTT